MLIRSANQHFTNKNYKSALSVYLQAKNEYPELKSTDRSIERCISRIGQRGSPVKDTGVDAKKPKVMAGIAAIPEREDALKRVVESLYDQVDAIGVFLNNWRTEPRFLHDPKIYIESSERWGDLGDSGKFFWASKHEGIYLTCDDDLIYPPYYAQYMHAKLIEYDERAVVAWHGARLGRGLTDYYCEDTKRVFPFFSARATDEPVHIVGTGCAAFHTRCVAPEVSWFPKRNMADIYFGLAAQEKGIPFYVVEHTKNQIQQAENTKEESIYRSSVKALDSEKNTRSAQNELISSVEEWRLHGARPLSILLIGRFNSYRTGGIYKSCHAIANVMAARGHRVVFLDSDEELLCDLRKFDLAWIYPGDPKRPDFRTIEAKITQLRANDVPVLVNFSYISKYERSEWIAEKLRHYNTTGEYAKVGASVFTEGAIDDECFHDVKEYIIAMPKTIIPERGVEVREYSEREGICIGDGAKLNNPDIIGGDVREWIQEIRKHVPGVNIYAYRQYSGMREIDGVTYVPYMSGGLSEWLSKRRLFVCLNVHLTFEMVACEAQAVGTPVLYRNMPHSLSQYVGLSGVCVRSPTELGRMIAWLYHDRNVWDEYSRKSQLNAEVNDIKACGASMEAAFRMALTRLKPDAGDSRGMKEGVG